MVTWQTTRSQSVRLLVPLQRQGCGTRLSTADLSPRTGVCDGGGVAMVLVWQWWWCDGGGGVTVVVV